MLTPRDREILEYEAVSILEATNQGPKFLSAKTQAEELLNLPPESFGEPLYAAEVQTAVRNLRSLP